MTNFDSIAKLWGFGVFKSVSRLLVYFKFFDDLCPFFFSAGIVNALAGVLLILHIRQLTVSINSLTRRPRRVMLKLNA